MIKIIPSTALSLSLALGLLGLCPPAGAEYPIAGVQPDQRPEEAPRITEVQHDQAWYHRALHGVSEPWPSSLLFLDHQGDWYTPFNRPGMPGRYDIRGWYQRQ